MAIGLNILAEGLLKLNGTWDLEKAASVKSFDCAIVFTIFDQSLTMLSFIILIKEIRAELCRLTKFINFGNLR